MWTLLFLPAGHTVTFRVVLTPPRLGHSAGAALLCCPRLPCLLRLHRARVGHQQPYPRHFASRLSEVGAYSAMLGGLACQRQTKRNRGRTPGTAGRKTEGILSSHFHASLLFSFLSLRFASSAHLHAARGCFTWMRTCGAKPLDSLSIPGLTRATKNATSFGQHSCAQFLVGRSFALQQLLSSCPLAVHASSGSRWTRGWIPQQRRRGAALVANMLGLLLYRFLVA